MRSRPGPEKPPGGCGGLNPTTNVLKKRSLQGSTLTFQSLYRRRAQVFGDSPLGGTVGPIEAAPVGLVSSRQCRGQALAGQERAQLQVGAVTLGPQLLLFGRNQKASPDILGNLLSKPVHLPAEWLGGKVGSWGAALEE